MTTPLLELRDIACLRDGQSVFEDVSLVVNQSDIVVLRGKSGSGKTTLLKCIAHLIVYQGDVLYRGSTPKSLGIPSFRTRVFYVPQRPSLLSGTPNDFLKKIAAFGAHQAHAQALKKSGGGPYDPFDRALDISREWGIDPQLWDREWSNLSGGEAQRVALAIAVGLNSAEVLLLDEPTSALDSVSSAAVERYLLNEVQARDATLKAIVWITHSDEQAGRVGTRFVQIEAGGCHEEPTPVV
ncbi:Phosphate import ATP-binding protein PstB 1 [Termitomyces sp. T112]|nr:Phosphate import ATP-binding protein PstB 1 [Termitomyces sp. T112]